MGEIHDSEAERALLGAVLASSSELAKIAPRVLSGSVFAAPAHAKIWDAMLALRARGQVVDHLVLANELKTLGQLAAVGGPAYIMELDQNAPIAANAEHYAGIVLDRARRRRMVEIGRELVRSAEDLGSHTADALLETSSALAKAASGSVKVRTLEEVNRDTYVRLNRIQDGDEDPIVPTGLIGYDNVVGGLQPTLNVCGGQTAGGKSGFAAAVIQNVAARGINVGVFSLEDSADWLTYRYLAAATGVPNFVMRFKRKSESDWEKIANVAHQLDGFSSRVHVDDTTNLSSREICARAEDLVLNHGAKVIVIDHLQEVHHGAHRAERHELAVRQSLSDFRSFANRYQVPVLLLAQVKESDGKRKPGDAPTLSDFQDAPGAIAKIARVAAILVLDKEAGEVACHFVKHTNGYGGKVARLAFIGGAGMLADLPGAALQLDVHSTLEAQSKPIPVPNQYRNGYTVAPPEEDPGPPE